MSTDHPVEQPAPATAAGRRTAHFSAGRREAVQHWDDLLQSGRDPDALVEAFVEAQRARGLINAGVPLCTVARPRLVAAAEMVAEEHAVLCLSSAVLKVRDAVLEHAALRAEYLGGFDDWAADILALEPRRHETRSVLRFDSFLTPGGLRFVEVNADVPMGSTGNDGLIRAFQSLDIYREFRRRYEVRPCLATIGMIQTFMGAWAGWGGTGTPRICVLSVPGGIVDQLAQLNVDVLGELGFEVTHAYPEDLDFGAGRLRAKGGAVDMLYRALRTAQVLERAHDFAPLLQAVRAEAVCMVNPFHSALMSNKAIFALLTDPGPGFRFSHEEQAAIDAHVPWCRTLRDARSTDHQGAPIDLVEHVLAHKDELVVKPAHEAGGAGVRLGWTCDEAEWREAVEAALRIDSVVQRRIEETVDEYPLLEKGFPAATFYEDTDPFVFPGGYVAVLDRISAAAITNVARGGSMVPTFVIDPR